MGTFEVNQDFRDNDVDKIEINESLLEIHMKDFENPLALEKTLEETADHVNTNIKNLNQKIGELEISQKNKQELTEKLDEEVNKLAEEMSNAMYRHDNNVEGLKTKLKELSDTAFDDMFSIMDDFVAQNPDQFNRGIEKIKTHKNDILNQLNTE